MCIEYHLTYTCNHTERSHLTLCSLSLFRSTTHPLSSLPYIPYCPSASPTTARYYLPTPGLCWYCRQLSSLLSSPLGLALLSKRGVMSPVEIMKELMSNIKKPMIIKVEDGVRGKGVEKWVYWNWMVEKEAGLVRYTGGRGGRKKKVEEEDYDSDSDDTVIVEEGPRMRQPLKPRFMTYMQRYGYLFEDESHLRTQEEPEQMSRNTSKIEKQKEEEKETKKKKSFWKRFKLKR